MVRRRSGVSGLAKQLTHGAYQHLATTTTTMPLTAQQRPCCLNSTCRLAGIPWLQSWNRVQPQTPTNSLHSSLQNLSIAVPQSELQSSSRTRRQRSQAGAVAVAAQLPIYKAAPAAQPPTLLPMWCRSNEQLLRDSARIRTAIKSYTSRQPTNSELSLQMHEAQLKQQQRLHQLQQLEQLRQWHMQPQPPPAPQGHIPFNFGKCAGGLIDCLDSRSSEISNGFEAARSAAMSESWPARHQEDATDEDVDGSDSSITLTNSNQLQQEQQERQERKERKERKERERRQQREEQKIQGRKKQTEGKEQEQDLDHQMPEVPEVRERERSRRPSCGHIEDDISHLVTDINSNLKKIRRILATDPQSQIRSRHNLRQLRQPLIKPRKLPVSDTAAVKSKEKQKEEDGMEQGLHLTPDQLKLLHSILQLNEQSPVEVNPPVEAIKSKRPASRHKRQLNLNRLFHEQLLPTADSANFWSTLMKLVAQMCDDQQGGDDVHRLSAGSGTKRRKKEYSVYLVVSTDDEAEDEAAVEPAPPPVPAPAPEPKKRQRRDLSVSAPDSRLADRKSRLSPAQRREPEVHAYPQAPPFRRPLHWPKPQYCQSDPQLKKPKKKLQRRITNRQRCVPPGASICQVVGWPSHPNSPANSELEPYATSPLLITQKPLHPLDSVHNTPQWHCYY